mmetsp:Transcript_102119/g.161131  ORF Transcript_102119/g.161131 Transcript_102119/m.161131 type:complete len:82 (+) Transcript_102119:26-271(+)
MIALSLSQSLPAMRKLINKKYRGSDLLSESVGPTIACRNCQVFNCLDNTKTDEGAAASLDTTQEIWRGLFDAQNRAHPIAI